MTTMGSVRLDDDVHQTLIIIAQRYGGISLSKAARKAILALAEKEEAEDRLQRDASDTTMWGALFGGSTVNSTAPPLPPYYCPYDQERFPSCVKLYEHKVRRHPNGLGDLAPDSLIGDSH